MLLYLHGAHLLGGYAMPAPVELPVIGRCPAEERPAQRHGGLHRRIPTAVNGAGESPDGSCGYILERGSKDSLSASQSQHRAHAVAVLPTEVLKHLHGDVVLPVFEKTAVDEQRHDGLVPGRILFESFEKVEKAHGQGIGIERNDKQHVGKVAHFRCQLPMVVFRYVGILGSRPAMSDKNFGVAFRV